LHSVLHRGKYLCNVNITPTCNQLTTAAATCCVPMELENEIIQFVEDFASRAGCTFDQAVETIVRKEIECQQSTESHSLGTSHAIQSFVTAAAALL
jgi:hypothetical protein